MNFNLDQMIGWLIPSNATSSTTIKAQGRRRHGWRLHITKRRAARLQGGGLTWIVKRTFAYLARNRRFGLRRLRKRRSIPGA